MRKMLMTGALVLAFSCPAYAGLIHTPAPQPAAPTTQETNASGEIPTPLAALDAALGILSGVLSLF